MIRAAIIVVLADALTGCAAPLLRQSVCVTPAPGAQLCQFAYEGDEEQ